MNESLLSQLKTVNTDTETQVQFKKKLHPSQTLRIGIPKEITFQENRVPLTPAAVGYLVGLGHEIIIQSKCGENANFSDHQYSENGATIALDVRDVYQSDVLLKIDPPTLEELGFMKTGQLLISALQINQLEGAMLKQLLDKKIHAMAYEFIEDESGALPIIRAMSELAGTASILIAAEYLNNTHIGKGELLGGFAGVPPTQVVVLGAGAVGEFATKAAIGLGANVKIFDNDVYKLRRIQKSFGHHLYTSTLQPQTVKSAVQKADVVIGAYSGKIYRSPVIVTQEMIASMKPHSVVIDVAIDRGGNFETSELTSHENPVFKKFDVIHYCVPNITSRVSRTASYALSNIFSPMLEQIVLQGGFSEALKLNKGLRRGTYMYRGSLTNKQLAQKFGLPFKDLDLLVGLYS
jgi:alanine dehydrogenase